MADARGGSSWCNRECPVVTVKCAVFYYYDFHYCFYYDYYYVFFFFFRVADLSQRSDLTLFQLYTTCRVYCSSVITANMGVHGCWF